MRRQFVLPLVGTAGIGRRRQAERVQIVAVLFAFADVDGLLLANRLDQTRQAIRDTSHSRHFPYPAALAIGPSLAKVFRLVTDDLKQQHAFRVGIVVTRDECPGGRRCSVAAVGLAVAPVALLLCPFVCFAPVVETLLAYDQVKGTTAIIVFMIEPDALGHIDSHRATLAEAQLRSVFLRPVLVWFVEVMPCDSFHQFDVVGIAAVHDVPLIAAENTMASQSKADIPGSQTAPNSCLRTLQKLL